MPQIDDHGKLYFVCINGVLKHEFVFFKSLLPSSVIISLSRGVLGSLHLLQEMSLVFDLEY